MRKTYTKQKKIWGNYRGTRFRLKLAAGAISLLLALPSVAGPREQAKRIHDRLTGVPPTEAVLDRMEDEISINNDPVAAAFIAIDGPNNPNSKYFYNVTLKNFATPWTNRDQDVFVRVAVLQVVVAMAEVLQVVLFIDFIEAIGDIDALRVCNRRLAPCIQRNGLWRSRRRCVYRSACISRAIRTGIS